MEKPGSTEQHFFFSGMQPTIRRRSGKQQIEHVQHMMSVAAKTFIESSGVLVKSIRGFFGVLPDFNGLQATSFVHPKLVTHQIFHVRHFAFVDGAICFGYFCAKPEHVKDKLPLPPLIRLEFAVGGFIFLGLVKKIMPQPRPHEKANQSTKGQAQEVEQKDAKDAADYFAFDFHCDGCGNSAQQNSGGKVIEGMGTVRQNVGIWVLTL